MYFMLRLSPLICFVALIFAPYALSARLNTVERELALYDCGNGNNGACDAAALSSLFLGYLVTPEKDKQGLKTKIASKRLKCNKGGVKSCTDLGVLLFHYEPDDNAEAYALFTDSCDSGDGWACDLLGEVSALVKTSSGKSYRTYYEKLGNLCTNGEHKACATQARLNILLADTVPDKSIWYDQLVRSCENGIGRACVNLSYLMSDDGKQEYQHFDPDRSTLRKFTKRTSFSYARKACELDNPVGCWNAAIAYSEGIGVSVNVRLAQEYFVKACVRGTYRACDEINYEVYWRTTDSDGDLEKACVEGDFTACFISEQRRFRELNEPGNNEAKTKYLASLKVICKDGSLLACANVAVLSRRAGDSAAAERFATVACNHEVSAGCFVLGNVWKFDKHTEGHHTRAVYYLKQACELGSRGACNNLGDSYRKGLGLEVSLIRAKRYFTIACNKKLELGCENLAAMTESN